MQKSQPIFKSIFGDIWETLPEVMHKRYANRPYSKDIVAVKGKMDIKFGGLIRFFSPLLKLLGMLVPYEGKSIPTTVRFLSDPESSNLVFERKFNFPDKEPFLLRSKMVHIKDNELIEFMGPGLGWHCAFIFEDGKVKILHRGYVLKLFKWNIPMPLSFILGKVYAEEIPETSNRFSIKMNIKHPFLGKIYEYSGEFEIQGILKGLQK